MRSFRVGISALYLFTTLFLVACVADATPDSGAAVQALQKYFVALTSKNESDYTQSICTDWESQAFLEFDAYQGLELKLTDLSCLATTMKGDEAQVTCQGKILLDYGNENQEVDLSRRVYKLVARDASWQVCGYTERAAGTLWSP